MPKQEQIPGIVPVPALLTTQDLWVHALRGNLELPHKRVNMCLILHDSLLSSKWPKLLVGAHSRKFVFMLWRGLAASEWLLPLPQVPSWILALCVCS